jgi:hypothetical protein
MNPEPILFLFARFQDALINSGNAEEFVLRDEA